MAVTAAMVKELREKTSNSSSKKRPFIVFYAFFLSCTISLTFDQ
ncbi:MAG: hypothetical protein ACOVQN_13410 [Exiguobacterium sp.]